MVVRTIISDSQEFSRYVQRDGRVWARILRRNQTFKRMLGWVPKGGKTNPEYWDHIWKNYPWLELGPYCWIKRVTKGEEKTRA